MSSVTSKRVAAAEFASPTVDDGFIANASEHVREMMEAGLSREEILKLLAMAGEFVAPEGAVSSILVLDQDGLLRNGSSPKLPADYLRAIDRLRPNARVGTCAAAAATGEVVLTPSFVADEKWAELRHLPGALGFVGAWSMPINGTDGRVLGTFGTYFRSSREPTEAEHRAVEQLAAAAALALAAKQKDS